MDGIEVTLRPTVTADAKAMSYGEIDRRIEDVMRVKMFCGELEPARERHFARTMAQVRAAAASPSVATRTTASLALELLALELCDD